MCSPVHFVSDEIAVPVDQADVIAHGRLRHVEALAVGKVE
jgi:hypothetical protein